MTFEDGSYIWYYGDTKFATRTHGWEQREVITLGVQVLYPRIGTAIGSVVGRGLEN